MKKKIVIFSAISAFSIAISLFALSANKTTLFRNDAASADYTLTINAGDLNKREDSFYSGSNRLVTDSTKGKASDLRNYVSLVYGGVKYDSSGPYQVLRQGNGYLQNAFESPIRSIKTINLKGVDTSGVMVQWGWNDGDGAIAWRETSYMNCSSSGLTFTFNGECPNYFKLSAPASSDLSFSKITITYDAACVESVDPHTDSPDEDLFEYTLLDDGTYGIKGGSANTLTNVVIPSTHDGKAVTKILERGFFEFTTMEEVTIPASITRIDNKAFQGCTKLEQITIPKNVSSIGTDFVYKCTSLMNVYVNSANTEYTSVSGVLYNSNKTKLWCYPAGRSGTATVESTVVTIGNGAVQCPKITNFVIPDGAKYIDPWAFYDCTELNVLSMPSTMTAIKHHAFGNCTSLEYLYIPESVNYIEHDLFEGCTSLIVNCGAASKGERWDDNWNSAGVTVNWSATDFVFSVSGSNASLVKYIGVSQTLNIPSTYNGATVKTIKEKAFKYVASVSTIVIPETITTIEGDAFYRCYSLRNFEVSSSSSNFYATSGVLYTKDKTELVSFPAGRTGTATGILTSVTKIGYGAIQCPYVTSVYLPDSVTTIARYGIAVCTNLKAVNIPTSVTSIGDQAFFNCESLETIYIPSSVTSIGNKAFIDCPSLKINCEASEKPSGWNSNWNPNDRPVSWGLSEFEFTYDGSSATLTKYNGSSYHVTIPSSSNGKTVTTVKKDTFRNNTTVTQIYIPKVITTIQPDAFYLCMRLNTFLMSSENPAYCVDNNIIYSKDKTQLVCVPAGRTGSVSILSTVTIICSGAVECPLITGFNIPDGVTSLEADAFYGCEKLRSISLPRSITNIGQTAFQNCYELQRIFIPNTVVTMGGSVFRNCSALSIYCEAGSKPSGWNSNWNPSGRPVVWGATN